MNKYHFTGTYLNKITPREEFGYFDSYEAAKHYCAIMNFDAFADCGPDSDASLTSTEADKINNPGTAFNEIFDESGFSSGAGVDAKPGIEYVVSRTVEITLPIFAKDKLAAIEAVREIPLYRLLEEHGVRVNTVKTSARVSIHV